MGFDPGRGAPDDRQPDETPRDETDVPPTSMSGARLGPRSTGSMSGLGPDEVDESGEPGQTPARQHGAPRSVGRSATTGGTGMIGGFDQPVLDGPTVDEQRSPRRGAPETES